MRLAFLSTRVGEAVLAGKQPSRLSPATVRSSVELPVAWAEQEAMFRVA